VILFSLFSLYKSYIRPFRHERDNLLNQEICIGWLIVVAIKYARLSDYIVYGASPLLAFIMIYPIISHSIRFIYDLVKELRGKVKLRKVFPSIGVPPPFTSLTQQTAKPAASTSTGFEFEYDRQRELESDRQT
jgi:hypothetical protein